MKKSPHDKNVSSFDQVLYGHVALDKKISEFYKKFVDFRNEANWKFEQILEQLKELRLERIEVLERRVKKLEEKFI